jgi:transposase InsO family protein
VLGARTTIRRVLKDYFACKRRTVPCGEQRMADLPADIVTPGIPPFSNTSVDFFGTFFVKRGRSLVKRYGCIFTCFTTRAIHIEVAHSLDTDSFINALQRFVSRRGQPELIQSDNGTNFVASEKVLREAVQDWNQNKIEHFLRQKGIQWKFNPPAASHMGGVWERQIRTVRKVLGALTKEQNMDDEGLSTLMCLVEAIVNGRPLTTVSDDARDPEPLTPNHLLLLRSGPTLPPGRFDKDDLNSRKRWRQIQYMADIFWKRWVKEYLPTLQRRQRWLDHSRNFDIGDVVLVVDHNTPRNMWPLARVVKVYPGSDGCVRSVDIQTRTSTLRRPITKLCLLESIEHGENVSR